MYKDGSISVFYLFVRDKFQWNVKEFTTFEGFSILAPILGNVFGILLLRKVSNIDFKHLIYVIIILIIQL